MSQRWVKQQLPLVVFFLWVLLLLFRFFFLRPLQMTLSANLLFILQKKSKIRSKEHWRRAWEVFVATKPMVKFCCLSQVPNENMAPLHQFEAAFLYKWYDWYHLSRWWSILFHLEAAIIVVTWKMRKITMIDVSVFLVDGWMLWTGLAIVCIDGRKGQGGAADSLEICAGAKSMCRKAAHWYSLSQAMIDALHFLSQQSTGY